MKIHLLIFVASAAFINTAKPQGSYPSTPNVILPNRDSLGSSVAVLPPANSLVSMTAESELLKALAQQHQARSRDATGANQAERAKWEMELADELNTRSLSLQTSIRQSNGRLASEESTTLSVTNGPPLRTNHLDSAATENPDETAYLNKLEELKLLTEQELVAATEEARNYALQLTTNHSEELTRTVSFLLQENRMYTRQVRKDHLELELKQLEFWALRRRK